MEHKQKLIYAMVSLVIMACGIPTAAMVYPEIVSAPVPVHKDTYINTEVSIVANMTVCNSGGLNVRPAAGDLSASMRQLTDGESVTVRKPAKNIKGMGMWYELADGGWVNARYLC